MITTLAGENSFGLQRELRQIVDTFVAEQGDLGLERLDGQEVSLDRISEALTSLPFLANKKLVVLRAPSANKQFTEQAEQMLSDIPETTDVIIVEPKLDKRLSYYKFLKKATELPRLSGARSRRPGSLAGGCRQGARRHFELQRRPLLGGTRRRQPTIVIQ